MLKYSCLKGEDDEHDLPKLRNAAGFMELRGTEKDGRKSDDYCMYCYKDGHFTYECTMQQ